MSNVLEKILEVRKSLDYFTKDTSGYKYKYVSGSQILAKVKNKMDEVGLLLYPRIERMDKRTTVDIVDKNGVVKTEYIETGDMSYRWQNVEDKEDFLDIPWYITGQQDDPSKAFGSGLTYSERYFLLKFFNIPTDDADPDANQKEKGVQVQKTEDNRPWMNQKQLESAVKRIHDGETDLFDKLNEAFKIKREYRQILMDAASGDFEKSLNGGN
jgi:hypothetical protein